jgi:hypothetical protein
MRSTGQLAYPERNEGIRLEVIDLLDDEGQGEVLEFFRALDALHVYWEYLLPSARQGDGLAVAALRERPWPPWGVGAVQVQGLFYVYPLDEQRAGVGGIFIRPEQVGNVGMAAALYRAALDEARRQGHTGIAWLVRDHAALADRVLRNVGFIAAEEDENRFYLSEGVGYSLYLATTEAVLGTLGLEERDERSLLSFDFGDRTGDRMATLYPTVQVSMEAWVRDPHGPSELRPIFSRVAEGYEPGVP